MTELLPNIFAVEVPKSRLFHFQIDCNNEEPEDLFCTVSMIAKGNGPHRFVELPYGSYEIMFTTKYCTEEQAASIVERDRGGFAGDVEGYKEYFKPGDWSMDHEPFKSAIKSLQSC